MNIMWRKSIRDTGIRKRFLALTSNDHVRLRNLKRIMLYALHGMKFSKHSSKRYKSHFIRLIKALELYHEIKKEPDVVIPRPISLKRNVIANLSDSYAYSESAAAIEKNES